METLVESANKYLEETFDSLPNKGYSVAFHYLAMLGFEGEKIDIGGMEFEFIIHPEVGVCSFINHDSDIEIAATPEWDGAIGITPISIRKIGQGEIEEIYSEDFKGVPKNFNEYIEIVKNAYNKMKG